MDGSVNPKPSPSLFYFYRDSLKRRHALSKELPGSAARYLLYGLDQLYNRGLEIKHNLNYSVEIKPIYRFLATNLNRSWTRLGGYGGDFATVWKFRHEVNAVDLIFSTVDTVGIPLVLLRYFGFICSPIVYTSIGLPERLKLLTNQWMRNLYYRAFQKVERIICYGFEETRQLREWLNRDDEHVRFLPFGVDTEKFRPVEGKAISTDVISIGADSNRDFPLLITFARRHPDISLTLITTSARAQELGGMPNNVQLITDVSFNSIPDSMASARLVALPLMENTYSGATTSLLQAMAMAKPIVVSMVGAIKGGYHLKDGVNSRLITPGDLPELEEAICTLLENPNTAQSMGVAARQTVTENLSWSSYVESLFGLFNEVIGGSHR